MQAYPSVPSSGEIQEKSQVTYRSYKGERRMPLWNTQPYYTLSSSPCFSPPPCWGDGWRIQIPLFYHTQCFLSLEASMPVNTPHPGTLPLTPRALIKSSFLTNYVLSLRGILRKQISPSHNEEEVFFHEASWLLLQVPPGGYLWGPQCAQSCLSLQPPCIQLRLPPGTSFWKKVDLWGYFGKARKFF